MTAFVVIRHDRVGTKVGIKKFKRGHVKNRRNTNKNKQDNVNQQRGQDDGQQGAIKFPTIITSPPSSPSSTMAPVLSPSWVLLPDEYQLNDDDDYLAMLLLNVDNLCIGQKIGYKNDNANAN